MNNENQPDAPVDQQNLEPQLTPPTIDDKEPDPPTPQAPSAPDPPSEEPEANVIFIGKRLVFDKEKNKEVLQDTPADEVSKWRRDGPRQYKLPDGEIQQAGFYHKDATLLIRAFPSDFKPLVKKGG